MTIVHSYWLGNNENIVKTLCDGPEEACKDLTVPCIRMNAVQVVRSVDGFDNLPCIGVHREDIGNWKILLDFRNIEVVFKLLSDVVTILMLVL